MLFHTWIFLAFFLIFYPVYLLVKGTRLKLPWLLAASYVFYGWWNPVYLLLIFWATTVDYLAVWAMARTRWKKPWLTLSIVNNLGLLGFFKYGSFVVDNVNALAQRCDLPYALSDPNVGFLSTGRERCLVVVGNFLRGARVQLPVASRHLVLRFPVAELHHRLLPGRCRARTQLHPLCHVRLPVPATCWPGRSSGPVTSCPNCTECRGSLARMWPTGCRCSSWDCSRRSPWPTTWRSTSTRSMRCRRITGRRPCSWPRSPLPGRSTSISAATPTWPAASAG